MHQCLNCPNTFPNWVKVNGAWLSLQRRKYCLECSPWKSRKGGKRLSNDPRGAGKDGKVNLNVEEIQKRIDDEFLTARQIAVMYHTSTATIFRCVKNGSLKFKSAKQRRDWLKIKRPDAFKWSSDSRKKASESRKRFLSQNPGQHAWKKSNHHGSRACDFVKNVLREMNVTFTEEFSPLLHLGRYFSIDIAFPDKKIGIEINGRQHYDEHGRLRPYYQDRHDLIQSEGWVLHEIPYHKSFDRNLISSL